MKRYGPVAAFSLVEVVLAIGIMAFALVAILALLPIGAESNQNSAESTRAANILTTMEADLRNTHPLAAGGRSQIFGMVLPYAMSGTNVVINSGLAAGAVETTGLDEAERLTPTSGRPRYQASVIYTQVSTNAMAPVLARLIVGWPAQDTTVASNLTDVSKVKGFVETYVVFPAP